jgi:acyl-CoA hydrolase/glyoxylase-like metal-dependent hydrolase (beta-lactamase superfamily II)
MRVGGYRIDVRLGPSANVVRVGDVLVDSGSGAVAAVARTRGFADGAKTLVLTHFHADHAGGAGVLGLPVAAHRSEAEMVNARDPLACDGDWLGFGIGPYAVDRPLEDGDRVGPLEVVHTPGQTPGHIALWDASARVAITGDLLQEADVAWVPFAGPWAGGALDRIVASVERIARLGPRMTIPGHGPPVTDVPAAVERTLARYERFRAAPETAVTHAVRRAIVSHVMTGPIAADELAAMPWARGAAAALETTAAALIEEALAALEQRGAVHRAGARYDTALEHEPRGPLANPPGSPREWPRAAARRVAGGCRISCARVEPIPASASRSVLVRWMGIGDTNTAGFVHGGTVMKLCDEAAGLAAIRHSHRRVVTAGVDRMTFNEPVNLGDLVTFRASVNATWSTSMEVGVRVEAERPGSGEVRHTSSAYLTMVALDDDGRPTAVPPLLVDGEADARRRREAQTRRSNRLAEREQLKRGE